MVIHPGDDGYALRRVNKYENMCFVCDTTIKVWILLKHVNSLLCKESWWSNQTETLYNLKKDCQKIFEAVRPIICSLRYFLLFLKFSYIFLKYTIASKKRGQVNFFSLKFIYYSKSIWSLLKLNPSDGIYLRELFSQSSKQL